MAAIAFAVLLATGAWLTRRIRTFMVRRGLRPDVIDLVARSAFVVVVVVALFVLVGILSGNAGVAASGLAVALIVAGLGVQDILRNYVSGVYLLTERRFAVGDEIEIGGQYSGKIVEIKLRVTYLRASKGKLIIVPNAELFNQIISVHSTET